MKLNKIAAIAATAASLCVATTAHAYKVDDTLEIKAKLFANALSVENDSASSGFHTERNYVEVRKHISDADMVRITLDQKADDSNVFVKYAYWQHKLPFDAKVKVGLHHTPFVDYDNNDFWGYRFVAKAYTDLWKLQTSSDSGVSLLGKVSDGMFEYYLSVLNGEGYQNTANGSGYAFAARLQVNYDGIHAGVVTHDEGNRGGVAGGSSYDPTRRLVFAFYENDTFRFGGQYLIDGDDGEGAAPVNGTFYKATGYNVQGSVKLPMGDTKASAFARYDSIDKLDNGTDETLTIVGLAMEPAKGITLSPNVQIADDGTNSVTTYGIHAQLKF